MSVLKKTKRNRAVLLRTRFTMLGRSETHLKLKIDADAVSRSWSRFRFRPTIYHIYQGQWRLYAGKCSCVYVIWRV